MGSFNEAKSVIASDIAKISAAWQATLFLADRDPNSVDRCIDGLGNDLLLSGVTRIREGFLLHRALGSQQAAITANAILAGDWCYASGLELVAETGDINAVRTLADLIADTASMARETNGPEDEVEGNDIRDIRWLSALGNLT